MKKTEEQKNTPARPNDIGHSGGEIKRGGQVFRGVVVSDKMKDTVVVSVTRFVKHQKYKKYYKISKKFKAHNPGNTVHVGDKVSIKESRPISKDKHFIVIEN